MAKSTQRIKYFAVGEYGDTYKRPHYHVILFNADIKLIDMSWQQGYIHYGDVTGASVGYTLKYITKEGWKPMHRNDDREEPRYQMSKGLGLNYLTKQMVRYHKASADNMYCTTDQGQKIPMPRYYKDKIWPKVEDELGFLTYNSQRKEYGEQNFQKYLRKLLEYEKQENYFQRKVERDKQNIRNLKLKQKIDKL